MCGLWTGAFRSPGGRTDHELYGGNLAAGQTEGKRRECNIEQGKIAEEITERFIRQYYSQELSLKTYDEIRNDDFKKTCPV